MEIYWYTWQKVEQYLFFNVNLSVNLGYLKHLNPHKKKYYVYSQFKKIKRESKNSVFSNSLTLFTAVA